MVAIKDFYWQKDAKAMGEGAVNWKQVFAGFAKAGYAGPMSLHLECDGGMDVAARAVAVKKDLVCIHSYV